MKDVPFEKDVRESLQRVEIELGTIHSYIEERVQQEREKSDKRYAPIVLWTGFLSLMGISAALIVPKVLALLWPN